VRPGEYPADPKVAGYLAAVKAQSSAALARPVARVAQRSTARRMNDAGESALGNLVADAVVDATRAEGVQVGFMNMGGLRSDFDVSENLVATFGQAQAVLPFSNTLVVMDMTGAQLRAVLEQQWLRASGRAMLQVSRSLYYQWDNARPDGQRVVPGSVRINGAPLDDARTYKVVANNFLAEGGDGYPAFRQAANKADTRILDLEALIGYLARNQPGAAGAALAAPALPSARIERVN
jgi:5'-nucleotidase